MFTWIILICLSIAVANFQNIQPNKAFSKGFCDALCTCEEKDGVLYINCEERNISKVTQVKVPPDTPFHLTLYKNDIVELHPDEMEHLKNAVSLHLGTNSIQELEPGVFSALGSLKKLHINSNFIVILKEDTFHGLVNLEYLQADTNFISVIEYGAFSKLIRLKVLILNDNSLEFFPSNIFRFLPLTHLDLRGNHLKTLPYVGFLEHIGGIMELLVEDNEWFCDCEILPLKIWIENMRFKSAIGEVVCNSPMQLKGSILSRVKREILCPSHAEIDLEKLSKTSTMAITPSSKVIPIQNLTQGDGTTPALVPGVACLKQCPCHKHPTIGLLIHCQDKGIQRISDLGLPHESPRELVLTGNMIQNLLQYDFVEYGSLKFLNLANNQIENIDDETFLSLRHLKRLYLNGNKLTRLSPGMFAGLYNIEYLYLEYNMIKEILSGTFSTMPNLKLLSLNNNRLQTLPPLIFHRMPLAELDLRKNLFMHLPVSNVLDHLDSLERIYLEDNPWDCSCDLVGLKQWIEKLNKDTIVGTMLCHSPRKVAKTDLRFLRNELLCPGLVTFYSLPTHDNNGGVTTSATTTSTAGNLFMSFTDAVPLSVLILGLLIVFLMIVFCAAGLVVLVLHRRRRSKKKQTDDQPRENSPIHLHYSMFGQRTTHHMSQRPGATVCNEPTHNPIGQVCRSPTYNVHLKEQEQDEFDLNDSKNVCRRILEKENDSPMTGLNRKFRAVTEYPPEFVTLGDADSLYRNILERERELQQLSITEYLRKNISQLQPAVEVHGHSRHEELKLMETIMYTRPRKVTVEQTKNEYFELKANLHTEPDYLEVLEQQTTLN
ncbi:SLIT and NTRK-like protein 6 [Lepisosteus oculatus]|uniref:SLIT and NTRK-like protein 6 n=1 Tax=Lepisosteus oculatus TaxID=7918 RepID=UPI0035F51C75